MKKIKLDINTLVEVFGQIMIKPSVIKHLKGGDIYVKASWLEMGIVHKETFTRRKVLRLIRRFYKSHRKVIAGEIMFWTKREELLKTPRIRYYKVRR